MTRCEFCEIIQRKLVILTILTSISAVHSKFLYFILINLYITLHQLSLPNTSLSIYFPCVSVCEQKKNIYFFPKVLSMLIQKATAKRFIVTVLCLRPFIFYVSEGILSLSCLNNQPLCPSATLTPALDRRQMATFALSCSFHAQEGSHESGT